MSLEHFTRPPVQGLIDMVKDQICFALGSSGCCCLLATKYKITAITLAGVTLKVRVRLNGCQYYDVVLLVSGTAADGGTVAFVQIDALNVSPAAPFA